MPDLFPISDIRRDIACQPREALNTEVVESYADAMRGGAEFPPVVIFTDQANVHWLADGYHRIGAAESAGISEITVERRYGERRAAILYSLSANTAHGLRRSNEDKRRAVDKMLADKEWASWSDPRIAEHCGVSHPFVGERRKAVEKAAGCNRYNVPRRGKDGKSYPGHRKVATGDAPILGARDPFNGFETVEKQVDALMRAWNAAGPEARGEFMRRIDTPVADNTPALRAV